MKTIAEREAEFRADLLELLNKHSARIVVTDDGKPFGMHSAICRIEMEGSFDYENCKPVLPYAEFIL